MAIELHHLNTHGIMEQTFNVLDGVVRLKARIAELEELNHDLCERVTDNDDIRLHWEEIEQTRAENERMKARIAELEEERRWRKFSDEKPSEDIKFLVINEKGFIQCCYYSPILHEFQIPVTHWMPLPSAPKDEK